LRQRQLGAELHLPRRPYQQHRGLRQHQQDSDRRPHRAELHRNVFGHTNRLTTAGVTYDNNGNLTYDGFHHYTWDGDGKLATLDSNGETYDALGRRVEQLKSGAYTEIVYGPGGNKLALMSGQTVTKVFAPLSGGATAVYTSSGLAYYRHPDWLGSSRLASTPGKAVYYDGAYAPYGENYAETGTTDRNFTGQNQDIVPDLYDFLYREYHPTQGRWVSPDPAGLAAVDPTNPQTWNRYTYVANKPLSATDPLGLTDCPGLEPGCRVDYGPGNPGNGCGNGDASCGGPGGSGVGGFGPGGAWGGPAPWVHESAEQLQEEARWNSILATGWDPELGIFVASDATADPATAACVASGLQSTFAGSSATAGASTGEVGGHWNFAVQLQFPSLDAANAFISAYAASAASGWPPPARFGSGPALHLENLGGWSTDGGTYNIGGTAHIDLFNPNNGFGGIAGHVGGDFFGGHIVQLFGGNIDPKPCPY
jgi:RHS repeat-associated protein